jgi:6-phosphofructokinase 1
MKRIGILTSGGDAPGMNACIRAAVRSAIASHVEVIGIRRGFAGLIQGDLAPLGRRDIANIIHQGGTILETARSPEFRTTKGRASAINGDGTFRGGTLLMQECGVSIVGIPGTIDNDVFGTDYSIGFDSAVNCALRAIDRIRDTANSLERLFFVEVMGHHTGFIAMESGIAGGAEELIIPEAPLSSEELCAKLKEAFDQGKKSAIVVVAEAEQPGYSFTIAQEVKNNINIESRVCILGHIQRGGPPTARDRVLASTLGCAAVGALLDGKNGYMVGEVKNEVTYTPLHHTWEKKKTLNPHLEELARLLSA